MTYGSNARVVVPGTASFRQATRYDDAEEDTLCAADRMALFGRLTNFNRYYNSGCTQHDIDRFSADWKLLLRADFTIKEMGEIFRAVSDALIQTDWDNPDFYKASRKTILENWPAWEDHVLNKISKARAGDAICVYNECAALRIKPSHKLSGAVHSLVARTIGVLKPPHFAKYLIASATLKDPVPSQHVLKLCTAIGRFSQTMDKEGIRVLWAAAALHSFTGNEAYIRLAQNIKLPDVSGIPTSWQKMIYDAHSWFGWDSPVPNPNGETPVTSNTEKMLKEDFTKCGFPTCEGCFIPEFPQAIDFSFEADGRNVWIECDGPSHFLDNPMGKYFPHVYDGKTLFRAALIQRVNEVGRVLHTPFIVTNLIFSKSTSFDAKKNMLEFLASAAKHMAHGTTALADLRYDGEHIDMLMMPLEPGKGIGAPFAQMRVR